MSRPCQHWAQFKCNFGDACGFSHDGPGGPSPLGVYPGSAEAKQQAAAPINQEEMTDAQWKQFLLAAGGFGTMGMATTSETQWMPSWQKAPADSANPSDGKSRPCNHWANFKCNFGDACGFSHDGPGGPSPLGVYPGAGGQPGGGGGGGNKSRPCQHWANFKCNFGDACGFSHDGPGGPNPLGLYPGVGESKAQQQAQPAQMQSSGDPELDTLMAQMMADQQPGDKDIFAQFTNVMGLEIPEGQSMANSMSQNGGNPGGPPCKHWEQFKCNFPNCKYSHEGPGGPSPLGPYGQSKGSGKGAAPVAAQPNEDDIFASLLAGTEADNVWAPEPTSIGNALSPNGGNPNGTPCKHWEQFKCNMPDCKYSHEGPGGPSPLGVFTTKGKGKGDMFGKGDAGKVCNEFAQTGSCRFGATCKFAHEFGGETNGGISEPLPEVGSPCKYWAMGKCNFPDCKFSHDGPGGSSPLGPWGQKGEGRGSPY